MGGKDDVVRIWECRMRHMGEGGGGTWEGRVESGVEEGGE